MFIPTPGTDSYGAADRSHPQRAVELGLCGSSTTLKLEHFLDELSFGF